MFEDMLKIANTSLAKLDQKAIGLPQPQVTVLATDNDFYVAVNDTDGLICNELKLKDDTKVVLMLTMWKSGQIDLSSLNFRKALVELDQNNNNTDIILQGKNTLNIKKLSVTIP